MVTPSSRTPIRRLMTCSAANTSSVQRLASKKRTNRWSVVRVAGISPRHFFIWNMMPQLFGIAGLADREALVHSTDAGRQVLLIETCQLTGQTFHFDAGLRSEVNLMWHVFHHARNSCIEAG